MFNLKDSKGNVIGQFENAQDALASAANDSRNPQAVTDTGEDLNDALAAEGAAKAAKQIKLESVIADAQTRITTEQAAQALVAADKLELLTES